MCENITFTHFAMRALMISVCSKLRNTDLANPGLATEKGMSPSLLFYYLLKSLFIDVLT